MAITISVVTEGASTANNQASGYNTASVTLTAGRLYVLGETSSNTVDPADPTSVTCGSATFTLIKSHPYFSNATPLRRITVWACIPASTVTATVANILRTNDTGCAWNLCEVLGFDTSSLANAIPTGKTITNFADNALFGLTVTMGALNHASNAIIAYHGHDAAELITKDANYTLLGTDTSFYGTPANSIGAQYIIGNSDLACSATWVTNSHSGAVGIEIAILPVDVSITTTTVAAVGAVPAPTDTADANTTPTTVADATAVPTPAVTTVAPDADITTTTVAVLTAVAVPVVTADANVTPTTVTAVASVPGVASVTATAALTTTTVTTTTLVSVPATTADARAPPDTVPAVAAISTPTVEATSGNVIHQTIPAFTQIGSGIIPVNAAVTAGPVAASVQVPLPTITADADVTPDTVEAFAIVESVFEASTSIDIGGPHTPPPPHAPLFGGRLVPVRAAVHGKIRQTMPAFTQGLEALVTDDELVLLLI